jgi:TatD DNase family protein
MLVDTHAHLTDKKFERDLPEVLKRSEGAGVERIVTVGDKLDTSTKSVALTHIYPQLVASVGIHPHYARFYSDEAEKQLASLAEDPKVVAIGEIGLDYHYCNSEPEVQKQAFCRQLDLARTLNLPAIIHCRDAYGELIAILQEKARDEWQGVVHCFSGTRKDAEQLLDMGYYLGIGGAVTYPNAESLRTVIREINLNRVVLETDSPYLAPQHKRGQRNEPSYIRHSALQVAGLRGLTLKDIAAITRYNATRLFGWPGDTVGEVAYRIRNNLYLNITNQCTNSCVFCQSRSDYVVKGHYLKLDREPSEQEILTAAGDVERYDEIVFCGIGEPTMRLETVKAVAKELKGRGVTLRLNTNGQGILINGRDILSELRGLIDSVSISLNAHNQTTYNRLCRPRWPEKAFAAVLECARKSKQAIGHVQLSVVDFPGVSIPRCRKLADELGIPLRVRSYAAL